MIYDAAYLVQLLIPSGLQHCDVASQLTAVIIVIKRVNALGKELSVDQSGK